MTLILQIPAGLCTEAKTSPRHLNFLKQLNKTTKMCYPYISGFKIHQGTQWVPRNTVTEQIYNITIRNLGIASGPSFFFFFQVLEGVMKEENFWWILILIAMKLPLIPSVRLMRKCGVGKTSPRFYHVHGQTSAAFPRYLNSSRFPHCSVQPVLMMSSRTLSQGSGHSLFLFFAFIYKN